MDDEPPYLPAEGRYETRTLVGVRGALRYLMAEPSNRLAFRILFFPFIMVLGYLI